MHRRDIVDLHAVPAGAKRLRMFFVRLFDKNISFVRLLEHFAQQFMHNVQSHHYHVGSSLLALWME